MTRTTRPDPLPRLYTLKSAAEYLQVSPRTLQRLIERGEIEMVRIGRQVRITEPELAALLRRSREL